LTDRLRRLDDEALGRAIGVLADRIAWPPTPDLASNVARRLRDQQRRPALGWPRLLLPSRRRALALLVAGLLLLAAAVVAARLVIDLGAVSIRTAPGRPTALPGAVASGPAFGRPTTLAEAEALAGFAARVPARLGPPDRVWVQELAEGTRIVLAWRPSASLPQIEGLPWGAVLYELRGRIAVAVKVVFPESGDLQAISVNGKRGYWITGPHELDLVTGDGSVQRFRVTGNVLVWRAAPITLRLETRLGREEAVRVARSAG